jgi:hypothetical protein
MADRRYCRTAAQMIARAAEAFAEEARAEGIVCG